MRELTKIDPNWYATIMVISDIHGSVRNIKKALNRFDKLKRPFLLIAGDFLVRNAPEGAALLREYRNHIYAVQGNCDRKMDAELLGMKLPVLRRIYWGKRQLLLFHGHTMSYRPTPMLPAGSIMISGHTHYPHLELDKEYNVYRFNPGSITLPRREPIASYGIITKKEISVHSLKTGLKIQSMPLEYFP